MIRVRLAGFPFGTVLAGVFSIGGTGSSVWVPTWEISHFAPRPPVRFVLGGAIPVVCPCTNILTAEVQDGFGLPFFCWLSRLHSAALKATERLLAMFNPRRC